MCAYVCVRMRACVFRVCLCVCVCVCVSVGGGGKGDMNVLLYPCLW